MIIPSLKPQTLILVTWLTIGLYTTSLSCQKYLLKVIAKQLTPFPHTKKNNIQDLQPGFSAHHSTETALVTVLNDLLIASDHGCILILVLLDISATFNTMDHHILLQRLKHHVGIKGCALSWFRSYLSDLL